MLPVETDVHAPCNTDILGSGLIRLAGSKSMLIAWTLKTELLEN